MSLIKRKYYEERTFSTGVLAASLRRAIKRLSETATGRIDLSRTLADGTTERRTDLSLNALETICDLESEAVRVELWIDLQTSERIIYITLQPEGRVLEVSVSAGSGDVLASVFVAVEEELGLREAPLDWEGLPLGDRIDALERGVEEIKAQLSPPEGPLRCFLSYRYERGNEAEAFAIQNFLRMLGVEVLTGKDYEPRRLSDKVAGILARDLDFVVLVLTDKGSSTWTRDEISFAFGRGIPVVPIVAESAQFDPGIFGDQEYITFANGHIGDAFTRLLEAVLFFRARRIAAPKAHS